MNGIHLSCAFIPALDRVRMSRSDFAVTTSSPPAVTVVPWDKHPMSLPDWPPKAAPDVSSTRGERQGLFVSSRLAPRDALYQASPDRRDPAV